MSATRTTILAVAAVVLFAAQSHAAGTAAGTSISNQASVDYTVGGVNQPDVNSNTVTFLTDRRINLTVAEVGGAYTNVAPGATAQVLTFTVTNTTNAPLDLRLDVSQDNGGNDAFGNSDDFDVTAPVAYVDSNNNGVYDAADTATYIDELAADGSKTVFIVANIPLGRANAETAGLTLTAIAAEPGVGGTLGGDVTQTAGADTPGSVDTVFGDLAGDTDAARDGKFSDDDAYRIQTATIAVTKTSTVISDPFNGISPNAKRIPGAIIEYCVTVQNNGSAPATAVVVTDVLTGQPVTYQTGTLFTEDTGTTCSGGDAEDEDAAGTDETNPNGGSEASGTVAATFANLPAGAGKAMRFRVMINN